MSRRAWGSLVTTLIAGFMAGCARNERGDKRNKPAAVFRNLPGRIDFCHRDSIPAQPGMPVAREGNQHILLEWDDPAEMTKAFEALAKGGAIVMPLADMFWGAKYGQLTDAFGVRWMFNHTFPKA